MSEPSATPKIQDVMGLERFGPLEPGTYFIDPDSDPSTHLRVVYEIPFEGWSQWFGALKDAGDGHVMINITTVVNLVRHGVATTPGPIHWSGRALTTSPSRWRIWLRSG